MTRSAGPVVVIGGGVAGLSAALALTRRGVPVTLIEQETCPGGAIRTERADGFIADLGPNTLLVHKKEVADLLESVGDDRGRLVSTSPLSKNRYIVLGGRPIAAPLSPFSAVTTPLFSLRGKIRLLAEPFIAPRRDESESIADFVTRRLGREALDHAVAPLVSGIHAGDPARLSMAHAFPGIFALERDHGSLVRGGLALAMKRDRSTPRFKRRLASFSGGLDRLPAALATGLGDRLLTGRRLTTLCREKTGWRLEAATEKGPERHDASAVILAIPPYAYEAIAFDPFVDTRLRPLAAIAYPPVVTMALGFRRADVRHPLDGFGALAPRSEGLTILGALFSSTLFADRAPTDHVLITCYLGGATHPDAALLPERELTERTLRDLDRLFGIRGAPVFARCAVKERAIPQYEIGYGRFLGLMETAEREAPGLFLAGSYRDGISVSAAILSGLSAADRLLAQQ